MAAQQSAVGPRLSFMFSCVFLRRSCLSTASCPFSAAQDNGVRPEKSAQEVWMSGSFNKHSTIVVCPFPDAQERGVLPLLLIELQFDLGSSCETTDIWPSAAANDSGVRPELSGTSTSIV